MKWPWLSREAHEAVVKAKDEQIALLTAMLAKPEPPAVAPVEAADEPVPAVRLSPREPNVIQQTIRDLAQGDTRMATYLHQRKRELKAEHPRMSDEGIAELLSVWETSESSFADGVNA